MVTKTPKWEHITPVLKILHWLPVKYRAQCKVLLLTFKGLYGLAPLYIADLLNLSHMSQNVIYVQRIRIYWKFQKLNTAQQAIVHSQSPHGPEMSPLKTSDQVYPSSHPSYSDNSIASLVLAEGASTRKELMRGCETGPMELIIMFFFR